MVEAIDYLRQQRTVIADRLPDVSLAGDQSQFRLDTNITERILGIKDEAYISWRVSFLEVVDYLLEWAIHYVDWNAVQVLKTISFKS